MRLVRQTLTALAVVGTFSGLVAVPAADAATISPVRALYLVPSDRAPNQAYASRIETALLDLQYWYAAELGGYTFGLASPRPQIVSTPHPSSYYSTAPHAFPGTQWDFWYNVLDDATAFGVRFDDPASRWAVYIDADPAPGQFGGAAAAGVAILPAGDLRGMLGQTPAPTGRWVGGLGHELGHTFGLGHPMECLAGAPPAHCAPLFAFGPLAYDLAFVSSSLMQFGYLTFPNTYLLPEERAYLLSTPFFARIPEPGTLALMALGVVAYGLRRRR